MDIIGENVTHKNKSVPIIHTSNLLQNYQKEVKIVQKQCNKISIRGRQI